MRIKTLSVGLLLFSAVFGQKWVDTLYQIDHSLNIHYGTAIDFAGNSRSLHFDLSKPLNDTPPACGRPLMVVVHGGAFIAGDKSESSIIRLRTDFAKRGYCVIAPNYRLGQFQTNNAVNCNISAFGTEWNCLNMQDSSEWYRAYYRAIQDVHGSIRYMVERADSLEIDPNNIYVIGESAGGFIALGVGFIDDASEVLYNLVDSMSAAFAPNAIYDVGCVQKYKLDTSISSMLLERSALGSFKGNLNDPNLGYTIKGVGNFFGAVFNPILETHSGEPPALFLYHQPNDLIVPHNFKKVFDGFSNCASQFPFNCQSIINRPYVYGSTSIKLMIDSLVAQGKKEPRFMYVLTTNNADCGTQISQPSLQGHAYDNFSLRTGQMAQFFAVGVDSCAMVGLSELKKPVSKLFPNPISRSGIFTIEFSANNQCTIQFLDQNGRIIFMDKKESDTNSIRYTAGELNLRSGVYTVMVSTESQLSVTKLVVF